MAATQRPVTQQALSDAATTPTWKQLPSYVIYGTADRNIPITQSIDFSSKLAAAIGITSTGKGGFRAGAAATAGLILGDQVLLWLAAAGVVADSVPESEWQETESKARAVLRAAELVQAGLQ